jgi:hypothetical protein
MTNPEKKINELLVVCEKHYYPLSEKSKLVRCTFNENGFKCPVCDAVYDCERLNECIITM